MLQLLRIRNLALVEKLDWELAPGFTAVTGETGAGKSVIIGALNLVLGERADKSLIRSGQDSCSVEAVFELADPAEINGLLEENGLDPCEEGQLIIRRMFSQAGSNRQFINGATTTLSVLKKIGDLLVDLHGPHDHQSLLNNERQVSLLDSYAGCEDPRHRFRQANTRLNRLQAQLEELSEVEEGIEHELELLRHQVREIEEADLKPDEEEALLARYQTAGNSRRLIEICADFLNRMTEAEGAVLDQLTETQRLLTNLEKLDPQSADFSTAHTNAVVELTETAENLRRYMENLELDEEQLQQLEDRINTIETLKRKYGGTVESVLAMHERAANRLAKIENREGEVRQVQEQIAEARKALQAIGKELSAAREKAAPRLAGDIAGQLRDLGFKKSGFEIRLLPVEKPRGTGFETAEFLFAPNPGEAAKPLKSIGSSGEMSRVMLALKSALAKIDEIPLLVFDEIDANVGGEIANAVGRKMAALGRERQLLCITHLPQVAALARQQFVVEKTADTPDQRTLSTLRPVTNAEREKELARMLGGQSNSALAHARELMKSGT
jgi:DNA repair protein RecN (Recombination protein N)